MQKILILNLGATSTKMAVCDEETVILEKNIKITSEELSKFNGIWEQTDMRQKAILSVMKDAGIGIKDISIIVSRGGNCSPLESGIYTINKDMLDDIKTERWGIHPSSVGCQIAYDLGQENNIPVVTVDPPVTDEFEKLARYSGLKEFDRISSFHALSQKSTARKICKEKLNKNYEDVNLIVCHLGTGISVGAHQKGKVIDVNNALDGDGPFSAERAGALPTGGLIDMCFSGKFTQKEILKKIRSGGGFMSYIGTNDGFAIEKSVTDGDAYVKEVVDALIYQLAKEIGAMATVMCGKVDAIAITGSFAYFKYLIEELKKRISFIGEIYTDPGENEMRALKEGALRALRKQETPKTYVRYAK